MGFLREFFKEVVSPGCYPVKKELYHRFRYMLNRDQDPEKLREFLRHHPKAVRWEKEGDMSPLHYALWQSSPAVDVLVAKDPSILEDRNGRGETALTKAASHTHSTTHPTDEIENLLRLGAKVDTRNSLGQTALHALSLNRNPGAYKILVDAGADPKARDNNGNTPLMLATRRVDNFNAMLVYDQDLTQRDSMGRTLLIHAICTKGEALSRLLQLGLDPNEPCTIGKTPIEHAINARNYYAVELLLKAGVKADLDNNDLLNMTADSTIGGDHGFHDFIIESREKRDAQRFQETQEELARQEEARAQQLAAEIEKIRTGKGADKALPAAPPLRLSRPKPQ